MSEETDSYPPKCKVEVDVIFGQTNKQVGGKIVIFWGQDCHFLGARLPLFGGKILLGMIINNKANHLCKKISLLRGDYQHLWAR